MRALRTGMLALAVALPTVGAADAIDDFVQRQMQLQHIPAVAIAVVKQGVPVKVAAYGTANLELGTPATRQSMFQIGSVSKQMIAMGVLLLVKDGRVALEDPLSKHVPELPATWQAITLRHLLTHSAGLPRETTGLQTRNQSDLETLREAAPMPLLFAPGEGQQYSNVGYSALAEVITRASGKTWPQFMQERVFEPLGMRSTRTNTADTLVPQRAAGYAWGGTTYTNAASPPGLRPSGAFLSSAEDMAKWDAALRTDVLLPATLREQWWKPVQLRDGSTRPYGLGWEIGRVGDHARVAHAGTMPGFRTSLSHYPAQGVTVVVLANTFGSLPEKIGERLAALQIPGLHPERQRGTMPGSALDAHAGQYRLGDNLISVRREGAELLVTRSLGPTTLLMAVLTPDHQGQFFDEASPRSSYAFESGEGGAALVMRDETGRETLRALRAAR